MVVSIFGVVQRPGFLVGWIYIVVALIGGRCWFEAQIRRGFLLEILPKNPSLYYSNSLPWRLRCPNGKVTGILLHILSRHLASNG